MSVLIKDINKPSVCGDCTFYIGGVCVITDDEIEYEDEILLDCPLEDLKESEDAISRQAVEYYIKSYIHEIITESGIDKNEHTNKILRAILNGVETMPSVNPQKVGRWIHHGDYDAMECSVCGEGFHYELDAKFCPSCGAKMDGGAKNE